MVTLNADVVVVGAGIAGSLVAKGLAERGIDTLLLDAGPVVTRAQALDRYYNAPDRGLPDAAYPNTDYAPRPLINDPDHYLVQAGPDPFAASYHRMVGGTTWHWEGVSLRFVPDDFRLKSRFGVGVDWPIDYADVEPWYAAAEQAIGVAADSQDDMGSPRSGPYPLPPMPLSYLDRAFAGILDGTPYALSTTPMARNPVPYDGRSACCGSSSCVQICPSGAKYDAMVHVNAAERAGARLVSEAVVSRVTVDTDGRVNGLTFKRPDGTTGRVSAKVYVLAAHGIETPKILLMSRSDRLPNGVANTSDQVGRNLMDHPYKVSWALSDRPLWPYRGPVTLSSVENTRAGDWRRERPAFRISVSNSGWAWPAGAPLSTVETLIDSGLSGQTLKDAIRDHTSRQVMLASMTEQLPDPANRIVPDEALTDAIGIPRPRLTYRFDDYTKAGMAEAERIHETIFARLGVSELQHSDHPWAGAHIMGTYRMGTDPRTSVVDVDLRSHDHENLFLLGSGVYPTGAAANPTLTIAALSMRAVEPIAQTLAM